MFDIAERCFRKDKRRDMASSRGQPCPGPGQQITATAWLRRPPEPGGLYRPRRAFRMPGSPLSTRYRARRRRACAAVGWYVNRAFTALALAERWNGARWVLQPTPSRANAALFAVSCTSARACTAVGSIGKRQTLAEAWNGTRWAIQPTPNPTGGLSAQLAGVSCASARACIAVGSYETRAFQTRTMAEIWNGTRWLIQATPNPKAAASAQLADVSCASARTCTAAGSSWITITVGKVPVNKYATLAEAWNGSRWRIPADARPAWRVLHLPVRGVVRHGARLHRGRVGRGPTPSAASWPWPRPGTAHAGSFRRPPALPAPSPAT